MPEIVKAIREVADYPILMINDIIVHLRAPHTPRHIGVCTECLLIHEVTPSADDLTDHNSGGSHVNKLQKTDLFDLTIYEYS